MPGISRILIFHATSLSALVVGALSWLLSGAECQSVRDRFSRASQSRALHPYLVGGGQHAADKANHMLKIEVCFGLGLGLCLNGIKCEMLADLCCGGLEGVGVIR